jgi:hypothetical protein
MASSRLFIQTFEHYDQARYNNRIYYLMREAAWFDMNLVLFECDGLGIMCQKVYTKNFDTDEQQEQAKTAYLSIDSASNRLSIQAEDGEVFYKILPP